MNDITHNPTYLTNVYSDGWVAPVKRYGRVSIFT